MKHTLLVLTTCAALVACASQPSHQSAYVGQEGREIKALAPAEVQALLGGKGMGFAKSAELNGYPGPAHVLELGVKLGLSAQQLAETTAIFGRMDASAKLHGAKLVQAERELEALFRSEKVTPQSLAQAVELVSSHQAKVRNAHLVAHVEQKTILTSQQVAQYIALRGYENSHSHAGHQ
jgi:hypothetical protein